jgi:hypothetical protein
MIKTSGNAFEFSAASGRSLISRKAIIAIVLAVALIAFEVFNFDTTQFALTSLLGEVSFAGVMWATILAIAFCAIDFAGLVRIFTPERGRQEPKAVWFLTGAWLLGTIANAIMTWWAVSVTLLGHEFGNEVLSREALLRYVPIFVAALVWLTRILFIGAFSVAGEDMMGVVRAQNKEEHRAATPAVKPSHPIITTPPVPVTSPPPRKAPAQPRPPQPAAASPLTYEPIHEPVTGGNNTTVPPSAPKTNGSAIPSRPNSRIQQRPPMPGGMTRPTPSGVQARSNNQA